MARLRQAIAVLVLAAQVCGAAAMEFRVAGKEVHVQGPVMGDELALFRDIAAAHPVVDTVVFHASPGGDLWTALRVGELIRDSAWNTVIAGPCLSACALMYLGGRNRHFAVGTPARVLGFHGTSSGAFLDRGSPSAYGRVEKRDWVVGRTGGKFNPKLMERFLNEDRPAASLYVFDPQQLRQAYGGSVFYCTGMEPRGTKPFEGCEKLPQEDAFAMGIVTSAERVSITPRGSLPAPFKPQPVPTPWK